MINDLNRKEFLRLLSLFASGTILNPQQLLANTSDYSGFSKADFGKDFLWGVSTAAYQMEGAFQEDGGKNVFVQSLQNAIKGTLANYSCTPHTLNRNGKAEGILLGGNLSLIAHLAGTVSALETKGKILFIEDVGEYIYNIDRMMIQLKRNGMLANLKGLVIGGFSEIKDTLTPFGADVFSVIQSHIEAYSYPVCFDFPVSHEKNNYALKIGVPHQLTVGSKLVRLKEIR